MGRFVIALAAALVVSGLGMFAPTSAVADDFGTCSSTTGCRADDANMDCCTPYAWDPTVWGAPFVAAMMNLDSQTDMYDTYMAPCTSQTDIGGYLDTSPEYPNGIGATTRGLFLCTKKVASNSTTCDQGSLVVNTSLLTSYEQRQKTFCHEIGHAAGLTHGSTYGGCMVSGSSTNVTYSAHHVAHINANY